MREQDAAEPKVVRAVNRVAYRVSIAVWVACLTMVWIQCSRTRETPSWPAPGAVALAPGAPGARVRWIVAVNPECATCRARLAALDSALAVRPAPPALGVLLVDVPRRPDSLAGAARFAAGVWWDGAGTWRGGWGRNAYGEVLVFTPEGRLLRILPPDSSSARKDR